MHIIGVVLHLELVAFVDFGKLIPAHISVIDVPVAVFRVHFGHRADRRDNGFHFSLGEQRPRKFVGAFKAVVEGYQNHFFR